MVNYKILSFNKGDGVIVINYEGYYPFAYNAPHKDGKYLSGDEFESWVQVNFEHNKSAWGLPAVDPLSLTNSEWIESKIDGTPFPITVPYPPEENNT